MNIHAILSWYDESPAWLTSCVSSLPRIGVDHVIAIDGRYPLYNPGAPARSRLEQVDAVTSAAYGCGIGITLHQPTTPIDEVMKRDKAFQVLNATAAYGDWVLVIDADEYIESVGNDDLREIAGAASESEHVIACRVASAVDPYGEPGPDNDINEKTLEVHQKLPVPSNFVSLQSRFFRVLRDNRCVGTHYGYQATDEYGQDWNLRPDIGKKDPALRVSDILHSQILIQHRKNHRTYERRSLKSEYYATRDELGIERV